jgi:hypothetical protein
VNVVEGKLKLMAPKSVVNATFLRQKQEMNNITGQFDQYALKDEVQERHDSFEKYVNSTFNTQEDFENLESDYKETIQ